MFKEKPLISVCMITYNQELYISDAIKGVLMQETNFPLELIIADDCSTDSTEKIVLSFIENHAKGKWIKYVKHSKNKGMIENFSWALKKCKGDYIAICEGDDFWTDSSKLENQIDFLESNPSYSLCFHDVQILQPDGRIYSDLEMEKRVINKKSTILEMILFGNYIHTPSVVFRNWLIEFPKEFELSPIGDYFLWILLGEKGDYFKIEGSYAVYRNKVGAFSTQSSNERAHQFCYTLELISKYINDLSLKRILDLRIKEIKISTFPYKANLDSSQFNSKKYIRDNFSSKELVFVVLYKCFRALRLK